MIGGKKGFKKSPSTNIIILDQNFWIVKVNWMIIFMAMFINKWQFIFVTRLPVTRWVEKKSKFD